VVGDQKKDKIMSIMMEAALRYAERGWYVFPARIVGSTKKSWMAENADRGIAKWGRTRVPDEIRARWNLFPDAIVGICTGLVHEDDTDPIWVLEVDTPEGHDVDGVSSLNELQAIHGQLPETLMAESPSGSLHRYFKHPPGIVIKNSTSKIGPGIDVRGRGGMVIAPPSRRGNGTYRWINEGMPVAEAPQWLIDMAVTSSDRRQRDTEEEPETPGDRSLMLIRVEMALHVIPNDGVNFPDDEHRGWDYWNRIGMAVYAATEGSVGGFQVFDSWSKKNSRYDKPHTIEKWDAYRTSPPTEITEATLFHLANNVNPSWERPSLKDFTAILPNHKYVYDPTGSEWPISIVDSLFKKIKLPGGVKIKASSYLDCHRDAAATVTWHPGYPRLIKNMIFRSEGGMIHHNGANAYNTYCPPMIDRGNPTRAERWLELVDHVLGSNHSKHFLNCLAHVVQHPGVKINHQLLIGGSQGIGKDTILEPLKITVGPWNFQEINPHHVVSPYNPFVKAVVVRVSEAHDLGDIDRYKYYEKIKTLTATPPDTIMYNDKYIKSYPVTNCFLMITLTNHRDSMFLPPDDRHTYVIWSEAKPKTSNFWSSHWKWYRNEGGFNDIAAFLQDYDLTDFNPAAAPELTQEYLDVVSSNIPQESNELSDLLDRIGRPKAISVKSLVGAMGEGFEYIQTWLKDQKNARKIPHRFKDCGYVKIDNRDRPSHRTWMIGGVSTVLYVHEDLLPQEKVQAAKDFVREEERLATSGQSRVRVDRSSTNVIDFDPDRRR
jgi:hypothetical protein